MSGVDERVRPSKREAEQAAIASGVAVTIVRPRRCTAPMCGKSRTAGARRFDPAAAAAAAAAWRAERTAFDRQLPYLASAAAFLLEKLHAGMITALIADAIPSPRPRLLQNCAPMRSKRRALLLHLDCCQPCSRCSTKTSFGNRWPEGSTRPAPARGARLARGREQRDRASAHDKRSYRLATVIA